MDSENRLITLLKATHEILTKCDEGPYVKDVMGETAHYDGTECDGYCLMEDIEHELAMNHGVDLGPYAEGGRYHVSGEEK